MIINRKSLLGVGNPGNGDGLMYMEAIFQSQDEDGGSPANYTVKPGTNVEAPFGMNGENTLLTALYYEVHETLLEELKSDGEQPKVGR